MLERQLLQLPLLLLRQTRFLATFAHRLLKLARSLVGNADLRVAVCGQRLNRMLKFNSSLLMFVTRRLECRNGCSGYFRLAASAHAFHVQDFLPFPNGPPPIPSKNRPSPRAI